MRLGSCTAEEELVAEEAASPLLTLGSSAHGEEHDPKVSDPTVQVCCRREQQCHVGVALCPG